MNTTTTITTAERAIAPSPFKNKIAYFTNDRIAGKLMSMGVLPGSEIELVRKAPLGGGWYVRVDRQIIALRKEELDCIVTERW